MFKTLPTTAQFEANNSKHNFSLHKLKILDRIIKIKIHGVGSPAMANLQTQIIHWDIKFVLKVFEERYR